MTIWEFGMDVWRFVISSFPHFSGGQAIIMITVEKVPGEMLVTVISSFPLFSTSQSGLSTCKSHFTTCKSLEVYEFTVEIPVETPNLT